MTSDRDSPANAVHWLVQENQEDSVELRAIVGCLETEGHRCHLVVLRKGTEIPFVPELPNDVPVICQGPAFVPRAMNYPRLRSGLFYDPDTFRWSAYQLGWQEAMLSGDACVVPLGAARELLRDRGEAVIRPDSDSKAFEGGLYNDIGLATAMRGTSVSETIPVVLASPVKIEAEWRFFIVNREVVGCSEYRRWGRLSTQGSVPHTAIEFAYECASRWGPADIYCLDLGATEGRIGIVEANCFNASRFYGSVITRILSAVNVHVLNLFNGS